MAQRENCRRWRCVSTAPKSINTGRSTVLESCDLSGWSLSAPFFHSFKGSSDTPGNTGVGPETHVSLLKTVTCYGAVDEPRVESAQLLVSQTHLTEFPRHVVFQQHVTHSCELTHNQRVEQAQAETQTWSLCRTCWTICAPLGCFRSTAML